MTEHRKDLLEKLIKVYNGKNEITDTFESLCEDYDVNEYNDRALEILVEIHSKDPVKEYINKK